MTATLPHRYDLLEKCHDRIQRQVYATDFGGTILHTVVVDGLDDVTELPGARYLCVPDGPHHDGGAWAFGYGVKQALCDLVMCVADDEYLEDTSIRQLVSALERAGADFAVHYRDFRGMTQMCGSPPVAGNLTTGLFHPRLWSVADLISGPSGLYSQPGADGQQAYDWLLKGATLAVVPQVLSTNPRPPGLE